MDLKTWQTTDRTALTVQTVFSRLELDCSRRRIEKEVWTRIVDRLVAELLPMMREAVLTNLNVTKMNGEVEQALTDAFKRAIGRDDFFSPTDQKQLS